MTQQKAKIIRLVYGIVLSVLIVCTGVCLIVSCVSIYQSGDAPFTRESIGAQFSKIAIPVWITIAAVVGGAVLALVLPSEEATLKGYRDACKNLEKMRARLELSRCEPAVREQMQKEKKLRTILRACGTLLSLLSVIPLLVHLLNLSNFTAELNASVIATVIWALPFLIVTGGAAVVVILLETNSVNRELGLVKNAIAAGAIRKPEADLPTDGSKRERVLLIARVAILAAAVLLVVLGILNGGMRDTLGKAIKICTECIGLG